MRPDTERNPGWMPRGRSRSGPGHGKENPMRFPGRRHLVPLFVAMLAILLQQASGGTGDPDSQGRRYRAVTFYVA